LPVQRKELACKHLRIAQDKANICRAPPPLAADKLKQTAALGIGDGHFLQSSEKRRPSKRQNCLFPEFQAQSLKQMSFPTFASSATETNVVLTRGEHSPH
jgi:hypothetical protein